MSEQLMEGFDPAIAQFRLSQIQLVNWGPFHGHHAIAIHRDGTLVTGPSGAGKSTLLDAMICVLMDRTVTFNAAAHDEAVGSKERTFYSYLRGKTGSRRDDARGSRAIYLRERATWSAVALTWRNQAGKTVTAVRAMHMTADATSDSDITHALMTCEHDLDLRELEPVAEQRLRQDAIRRALPFMTTFGNEYGRYLARLSTLVGIRGQDGDSAKAIRLLHKAQSSKGVQNIDETFKRFVLDDSKVTARRDTAVEQFISLRNGYQEMVRARDQVTLLAALPDLWTAYLQAGESSSGLRTLVTASDGVTPLETYLLGTHKDLLGARATHVRAEHTRQRALHVAATAEYDELAVRVRGLERDRSDHGGDSLDQIDTELRTLDESRRRTAKGFAELERWCALVGWAPPQDEREFSSLLEAGPSAAPEDPSVRAALFESSEAVAHVDRELRTVRGELSSLEKRRSNIPDSALRVRQMIADGSGLTERDLPFIGELIDVTPGQEDWRTAAERLLGGFGLRMLVDSASYPQVARFVDGHDLRARVRYSPVDTRVTRPGQGPADGTMAAKIEVADSPFGPWIREQLVRRFSHVCVRDVTELSVLAEAVTINGLVKFRDGLHDKDDRADVNRHRVLGLDNEHAKQQLADAIAELEEQRLSLVHARDEADAAREHSRAATGAWASIASTAWSDVDVRFVDEQIAVSRERRADVAAQGSLSTLDTEITALTEARDEATFRARTAKVAAEASEKEWARRTDEEDRIGNRLDSLPEPDPDHAAALAAISVACDPEPTLDTIARLERSMRQAIDQRVTSSESARNQAQSAITTMFTDFLHRWPDEAGTFTREVQDAPAYLSRLDDLRRDDLPGALAQWRQLMHNINTMGLTSLIQTLRDERIVVDERISPVNDVLRSVPFGHDGYLQIVTTDVEPPASRDFKVEIDAILENTLGHDLADEELETRFARIARLMDRLDSTDPADREWQRDVLDVKRHVRISAEEHRHGEDHARVYEGVGATSGGEGQELIAATLGAALRYQLGGIEEVPVFGSVMVDEGFVKSDPDVTRRAIRALQSFGFQLIIAAPLDKYQSMEGEFGSAYLIEHDPAAGRAHARGFEIGFGPTRRAAAGSA